MAQTRISIAAANYMLDALVTYLDAGAGSPQHATIEVFTASQPANPDTAEAGTRLGTLVCSRPSFGAAADAGSNTSRITANTITEDSSADATGTAAWARLKRGDGLVVLDGDVTATGGGGTFEFNTVSFVAAGPIRVTSLVINLPRQ